MKTAFRLLFCGLLLLGWGLAALSLHVVRTPTAIGLIPKDRLGITDTFVDTRSWTLKDAADHPAVISRILATGQSDLLRHIPGSDESSLSRSVQHSRTRTSAPATEAIDVERSTQAVKNWWAMR